MSPKMKLPDIPKCIKCGRSVIGNRGDKCRACQVEEARDTFHKASDAEKIINKDKMWQEGYSPWRNILMIPVLICLLIAIVIAIYFISG